MITAFSFIIFVSLQHLVVLFPFVLPFLSLIDFNMYIYVMYLNLLDITAKRST